MKTQFPIFNICNLSQSNQEDIIISRFASYLEKHQNLILSHKHSFYHLVLFTEGAGSHAIDFQSFLVKPYQLYFMVPGQVHSWSFEGKVDGYVVNFSTQFFQSLLLKTDYLEQFPFFSGSGEDSVVDLPDNLQPIVLDLFEKLVYESEALQRLSQDMVRVLLLQLFILIGRLNFENPTHQATAFNYTLVRKYQKLVEKNYTSLKLPKEYAELLFITPSHLNTLCNEMLGLSAGEVIRDRIMLEAKRLLTNLALTISEVADQLNFADNSYFTKFFKKSCRRPRQIN
ncbi:helix-turn-helix transcriptional regulator [Rhodocytophaga aerolata]|uniref:Helix-turn-helix transcriptional regulator n=1 Tax=Rhodocytophaga aerolata TaxID=455078 RepID=A0ABT8RI95_9BACT|nr:helix-turn-helix transcriptional regulator [Rhodocytophaga aerolata]MDO1450520.1 helix-turn-helix transcriptional regulator [Rhodocytophaga aerolata]